MNHELVLEWMARIREANRGSPFSEQTFRLPVGDALWVAATDSRVMVLVPAYLAPGLQGGPTTQVDAILEILDRHPISDPPDLVGRVSDLKKWTGLPEWVAKCPTCVEDPKFVRPPCRECLGSKIRRCVCQCGDEHEVECMECTGTGLWVCATCEDERIVTPDPRGGILKSTHRPLAVVIDRNLLARALDPMDEHAMVSVWLGKDATDCLRFVIQDGADPIHVLLMPWTHPEPEANRGAPVFGEEHAVAAP